MSIFMTQDDRELAAALQCAMATDVKEELKEEDEEWVYEEEAWPETEMKEEDADAWQWKTKEEEEETAMEPKEEQEDQDWSEQWPRDLDHQKRWEWTPRQDGQQRSPWNDQWRGRNQQWWSRTTSTWSKGWGKGQKAPWSMTKAPKPQSGAYVKGGFKDAEGTVWPTLVQFQMQAFQMALGHLYIVGQSKRG